MLKQLYMRLLLSYIRLVSQAMEKIVLLSFFINHRK